MPSFEQALEFGKTGESVIANFLKNRGHNVLPVYEKESGDYKGPAIYLSGGQTLVAPDMLVFGAKTLWVEAKHKTAFTWHRISQRWTTGIDAHHFAQYLKLAGISEWPIWLLFLHRNGESKDTPAGMSSPTGLFGGDILELSQKINHKHDNWGRHGMVYWAHKDLKLVADLADIL